MPHSSKDTTLMLLIDMDTHQLDHTYPDAYPKFDHHPIPGELLPLNGDGLTSHE
jgi:hypothetical protein